MKPPASWGDPARVCRSGQTRAAGQEGAKPTLGASGAHRRAGGVGATYQAGRGDIAGDSRTRIADATAHVKWRTSFLSQMRSWRATYRSSSASVNASCALSALVRWLLEGPWGWPSTIGGEAI